MKNIEKWTDRLCWKSLSFCCDLKKECYARDRVLKEIRVTPKEFLKLKDEFDRQLKELIRKKPLDCINPADGKGKISID
jgi:predicted metal-binding transcription factor (methanogenesis marker protein 9)